MSADKAYIAKILSNASGKAKKKALLIQNNHEFLAQLYRILQNHDFEVISSLNALEAYTHFENDSKIELVVFDAFLPHNSGLALLAKLKSQQQYAYTPIIMTLDHGDQNVITKAIKLKVDGIILQPFTDQNVMSKIYQARSKGRQTILIVDDDPLILDILKHVIELERFNVLTTTSSENALEILKSQKVDALVSDVMMPGGMSGVDLLKISKTQYPDLPVIIITGGGHSHKRAEIEKDGADGFFKKPFHNIDLIKTLRQVLKLSKTKQTV